MTCKAGEAWSARKQRCEPLPPIAPEELIAGSPLKKPIRNLKRVQACLKKRGYYKDAIDGIMGRNTFMALVKFRNDYGLNHRPWDFWDLPTQQILFSECDPRYAIQPLKNPAKMARNKPQDKAQDKAQTPPAQISPAGSGKQIESVSKGITTKGITTSVSAPKSITPPAPQIAKPSPRKASSVLEEAQTKPVAKPSSSSRPRIAKQVAKKTAVVPPKTITPHAAKPAPGRVQPTPQACLPERLVALHNRRNSGLSSASIPVCRNLCLPPPAGMSLKARNVLAQQNQIRWCAEDCLKIETEMPLKDILRIESQANVTVCAGPAKQVFRNTTQRHTFPLLIGKSYPQARALFQDLPAPQERKHRIAIIIGNRHYPKLGLTKPNAHRDAGMMNTVLSEHLGYGAVNILDLRDASLERLQQVFGRPGQAAAGLQALAANRKGLDVLIYFSGAAGFSQTAGEIVLLGIDQDANWAKAASNRTGLPLSQIYQALEPLAPRRTRLVLETDFSGDFSNRVILNNLPTRDSNFAFSRPAPNVSVFMATRGNQKNLADPVFHTGLFTRYIAAAISGAADKFPYGNQDGLIDDSELFLFAAAQTELAAAKSYGLFQAPVWLQTPAKSVAHLDQK